MTTAFVTGALDLSSRSALAIGGIVKDAVDDLKREATDPTAYAELRRPPVPWPGPASYLLVRFVLHRLSGRGLHRTRHG